jgi:amino acid transporter
MVGGGIFAVLGLAVQLAGGGKPLSFIIGGIDTAITSYSYVQLSIRYPSQGGTVVRGLLRQWGVTDTLSRSHPGKLEEEQTERFAQEIVKQVDRLGEEGKV